MTDQPSAPANWYTDPQDESQYRYWDGSAWTGHRAPRYVEQAYPALRPLDQLMTDSMRVLRSRWRDCAVVALLAAAAQTVAVLLLSYSADRILLGELAELLERVSESDVYADADNEVYFESLEVDFSVQNVMPGVLGLLLALVTSALFAATVVLLARAELCRSSVSLSTALRQACRRVHRMMGVDLQIVGLVVAGFGIVLASVLFSPWLILLTLPALLIFVILAFPVFWLADVVAATGPREPSLLYAQRLVQPARWGVLGRALLFFVLYSIVAAGLGTVVGVFDPNLGPLWWASEILSAALFTLLSVPLLIAAAITYSDLGGDWEQET